MNTRIYYETDTAKDEISKGQFEDAIFYLLTDANSTLERTCGKNGITLKFAKKDGSKFFKFNIVKEP